MSTPVSVAQAGGLAWVTIDNPPVNATSAAVRGGLEAAIDAVAGLPVRAVVLRCAGRTFVAGGDITEFDAPPVPPHLPDVIRLIEDCGIPWIAALHGSVFGGGLEIALGCAWRVAAPGTRLALPEVTLGIVPGAGGTQRLPRLVGLDLALHMATTGAPVTAEAFHAAGGLDALLPDLDEATLHRFADGLRARPTPVRARAVAAQPANWWQTQRAAVALQAQGAAAPMDNLDLVAQAADTPFDLGQPRERARHLHLRVSPESRALRHIFFAERAVARLPKRAAGAPPPLTSVAVIGADPRSQQLADGLARAGLDTHRTLSGEAAPGAVIVTDAEPLPETCLPGTPTLRALDPDHGAVLPPGPGDVTLGLPLSSPGVLEIAAGPGAPAATIATALTLAKRLGFTPVMTTPSQTPGETLVTTRLGRALRRYSSGGDVGTLAAAWHAFGGRSSPWLAVALDETPLAQDDTPPPRDDTPPDDTALTGLLAVLINEGALAVEEGCVGDPAAIDVISVGACGFPRWRGGPMHHAETIGPAQVAKWMESVMTNQPGKWRLSHMLRRAPA